MGTRWSAGRIWLATAIVAAACSVVGLSQARAAASCVSNARTYVLVEAASTDDAVAAIAAVRGKIDRQLPLVNAVAAWVGARDVPSLAVAAGVLFVSPSTPVKFQADSGVPREASAVYPAVVGAPQLWSRGITGSGVGVALIDTGIAPVPDLAGRIVGGVDLSGGNDPFADEFGHGTFVAGLVAGNGASSGGAFKGMAPGANLISVKIAGADGAADVSQVLAGIQWAVSFRHRFNIRVINLSLGTDASTPYQRSLLNYAVERAWDAGIVVVTSASNHGPTPGTVTKPGDDPLVITAGALDDAGTVASVDDTVPGFSGVGPTADGFVKPDLIAPGRSVVSLRVPGSTIDTNFPTGRVGDAYFKGSGTSFSTAVVTGAVADLLEADGSLAPDEVKSRLLGTAAKAPSDDPNVVGKGVLDVAAASVATVPVTSQASIPRSTGEGTLAADRGRGHVTFNGLRALSPGCSGAGGPAGVVTDEATAQGRTFDRAGFKSDWSGNSWYGSTWSGNSWYGNSWYGNSWYGNSWYGNSWYNTTWAGNSWYGNSWYGNSWYGNSWYGNSWYAVAWQ